LAADGWHVLIHYFRSPARAQALAAALRAAGGSCDLLAADLASQHDIEQLMPRAVALVGRVDCLINNAARFRFDDIASVTWESLQDHLMPNLAAPLLLSRAFAEQAGSAAGRPRTRSRAPGAPPRSAAAARPGRSPNACDSSWPRPQ
jgi:NAD(P)-dependent dehydrogenase (short-subunit alcohol dehydrogenase family)